MTVCEGNSHQSIVDAARARIGYFDFSGEVIQERTAFTFHARIDPFPAAIFVEYDPASEAPQPTLRVVPDDPALEDGEARIGLTGYERARLLLNLDEFCKEAFGEHLAESVLEMEGYPDDGSTVYSIEAIGRLDREPCAAARTLEGDAAAR